MLPANFSLVAEETLSVTMWGGRRELCHTTVLWQCWLSRVPEGTGLLTDALQFNPTHFSHKGIVGLRATRELSLTSSSDP